MTITPQMIEAAARALRDCVAGRSTFTGSRKPRPWESLPLTAGLAAQRDTKKILR
jgi:hypothetical protein